MSEQRYLRFRTEAGDARWGVRRGDRIHELSGAPWLLDTVATGATRSGDDSLPLLAPAAPTKILALAYNYKDLFADPAARTSAREAHYTDPGFEPLVFLKGPNCLADPGQPIAAPAEVAEMWVEVEVAAVIGRRARAVDAAGARDAIFGLTIGNDITALNVLGRDWHLARSKSLDGFCPLGPELVRGFDDGDRRLGTRINERTTQDGTTATRVLDTYASIALASRIMTLEPGDVVLTGTPAGARQSLVVPGDVVTLHIDGLGVLSNPIVRSRHE
ncbi:MAG: fumarylacetoacetate hydrolase family protein [Deltaproteobacteria bacterium]|nr:fumarylacetoacetate hydrolase family protein [Deltaproteobacteria bacterium]